VAQHAALRAACGPRRVDDFREVGGTAGLAALLGLLRRDAGAERFEVGKSAGPAAADLPRVGERGKPVPEGGDHVRVTVGLDDDGGGGGVAQDPPDLIERGCGVDRHDDAAGRQDRVIEERPLEPRARHQRHPVARLDARRDEPGGQAACLGGELVPGDRLPAAGRAP
jgi:hypothetical protein